MIWTDEIWTSATKQFDQEEIEKIQYCKLSGIEQLFEGSQPIVALRALAEVLLNETAAAGEETKLVAFMKVGAVSVLWQNVILHSGSDSRDMAYFFVLKLCQQALFPSQEILGLEVSHKLQKDLKEMLQGMLKIAETAVTFRNTNLFVKFATS